MCLKECRSSTFSSYLLSVKYSGVICTQRRDHFILIKFIHLLFVVCIMNIINCTPLKNITKPTTWTNKGTDSRNSAFKTKKRITIPFFKKSDNKKQINLRGTTLLSSLMKQNKSRKEGRTIFPKQRFWEKYTYYRRIFFMSTDNRKTETAQIFS